jgi:hypothetical protein
MIEILRASHMKFFTYPSQNIGFYEFINIDGVGKTLLLLGSGLVGLVAELMEQIETFENIVGCA